MKANSEELMIFVSVVENGSFSQAAEKLQLANSSVSRAVKKLEKKLGVSLLNRTTRQLSLTDEGKHYFNRIQHALQEMTAAENELIDAATPVVLHLLMPMIKAFRMRYPEITISLISSENYINLIERKVDIAIRAGKLADSSLRARLLFSSRRKIVASPEYLQQFGVPQTIDELQNHLCLGFTEPSSLNSWPISEHAGQQHTIAVGLSSNSG